MMRLWLEFHALQEAAIPIACFWIRKLFLVHPRGRVFLIGEDSLRPLASVQVRYYQWILCSGLMPHHSFCVLVTVARSKIGL